MIKKSQLIAVGFMFFGLLLFGAGIYLLAGENPNQSPIASNAASTPAAATSPVSNKAKTKPTPSPKPTAEPTLAPVKRPPSSVQWISRDSYLGGNTWKVNLTSDKWFDTGIPYVTNDTLNIHEYDSQGTDTHTLIKVNGEVFSNKEGQQIFYFDRDGFPPSISPRIKR